MIQKALTDGLNGLSRLHKRRIHDSVMQISKLNFCRHVKQLIPTVIKNDRWYKRLCFARGRPANLPAPSISASR